MDGAVVARRAVMTGSRVSERTGKLEYYAEVWIGGRRLTTDAASSHAIALKDAAALARDLGIGTGEQQEGESP